MAYSIEKRSRTYKDLYSLFSPPVTTRDSLGEEDKANIGARYLSDLKIILDYCAPQRESNSTALAEDATTEYISYLEKRNSSLSLRLAELERKFKSIEPYLPYIPTIVKIIGDYTAAETRVEERKKYLREKYSLKKAAEIRLWTGAKIESDIADSTLDEMLREVDEE